MIIPIHSNIYLFPHSPFLIYLLLKNIISVNLRGNWEKLESDLIFKSKLKFNSSLRFMNRGSN